MTATQYSCFCVTNFLLAITTCVHNLFDFQNICKHVPILFFNEVHEYPCVFITAADFEYKP